MCGLAGILAPDATEDKAAQMGAALRHRGPDSHGTWAQERDGLTVALAHRRLAIIDITPAGHQPMTRGPATIVYNGEIYNLRELQREVRGAGLELQSESDTEVLLHLYNLHGPRMVERLIGMFAFAIWDQKEQLLFAARDRLGIKPFLYRQLDHGLAFASEVRPLAQLGGCHIDSSAVRDVFTYKYIPTPKSIFREIAKLPAASTLIWRRNNSAAGFSLDISTYWTPTSSTERVDLEEATEELDQLLHRVIQEHTLSDVPVGVFLSGGVDSSTVASHLDRPYTFNLGFDVRSHDETDAARAIAEHLGAHHETLRAEGGDLTEALEIIADIYDEPFGDHGGFPIFLISRLARRDAQHPVTVALTGEGGDELFAGYQWQDKQGRLEPKLHHRFMHRMAPRSSAAFRSSERRMLRGVERYATFLGPFTVAQKYSVLGPSLMRDQGYDDLWAFRRYWREDLQLTKRIQWIDLHAYLQDDMMTKLDRATMAVSLEARPPLCDHRVVEFAMSLHPDLLFREGRGKILLRRALAKRVPLDLLTPGKVGLTAPVRRWSKQQPELLRSAQRRLFERGILRRPFFRPATNEQMWCLLVLDCWLQANERIAEISL